MVWVVLGLVIVLGGALVVFNRLVQLRNRAAGSWSDIDVQLKRRHDLVGNLVEAVKGYAYHERQVLEKVAAARSSAEGARTEGHPGAAGAAESTLSGEMGKLFALAEAYPDLKASEQFSSLQARTDESRGRFAERPSLLQRNRARSEHAHPIIPGSRRRPLTRVSGTGVLLARGPE